MRRLRRRATGRHKSCRWRRRSDDASTNWHDRVRLRQRALRSLRSDGATRRHHRADRPAPRKVVAPLASHPKLTALTPSEATNFPILGRSLASERDGHPRRQNIRQSADLEPAGGKSAPVLHATSDAGRSQTKTRERSSARSHSISTRHGCLVFTINSFQLRRCDGTRQR
jgi:hypothetical protein